MSSADVLMTKQAANHYAPQRKADEAHYRQEAKDATCGPAL
jgi:hypothetical protein